MALRHKSRHRLFFSLDDLTEEPDGKTLVEEVIRTKERDQILHICMDELRADYREALYLTYFEGMSYRQAAEVMGKSEKQITKWYTGEKRVCADYWSGRELPMRSNEERIAEVKRRIAEKEYKKRLRREWAAAVCCVAACLAVIAGVSLSMPDIVSRIEMGTASNFETTATMLGGSSALGYIVVGLLAFVLGVCVTVLCFRIRRLNEEEQTGEPKGENADGSRQ